MSNELAVVDRMLLEITPAKPSEVVEIIKILSEALVVRKGDEASAETRLKAFLMAVDDMPKEAITAAATAFIKGRAAGTNKTFLPTCAEFATEVRLHFFRIQHEKLGEQ